MGISKYFHQFVEEYAKSDLPPEKIAGEIVGGMPSFNEWDIANFIKHSCIEKESGDGEIEYMETFKIALGKRMNTDRKNFILVSNDSLNYV